MDVQYNPIRTLVVDDSQDECALLNAELRLVSSINLIGFLHDGVEAISYLRGIEQFRNRRKFPYPDLLLLDFNMPRCGGMEVLEFLNRQSRRPHVILWSNALEQISIPLALRLGADLVCRKPLHKLELTDILHGFEQMHFGTLPHSPTVKTLEIACVNA